MATRTKRSWGHLEWRRVVLLKGDDGEPVEGYLLVPNQPDFKGDTAAADKWRIKHLSSYPEDADSSTGEAVEYELVRVVDRKRGMPQMQLVWS